MSLETLVCEHRRIDPLAIVAHAQSELLVVVADLDLDPPGMRVPEGIPKGFRRNLVDLVTNDRVQISRLALDCDTECGRLVGARVGRELVAKGPDRDREIVTFDGRRPQALHRVPAFGDRLRRVFNRTIQFLFRLCRALRQQVRRGLEPQQQSVEALQQRVVQLPRDARALVDAFVEASLVLTRDLANAPPIPSPHETEGRDDDERLEPPCLVIRRRDREGQRCAGLVPHTTVVACHDAEAVGARWQVRILHLSIVDDLLPVGVLSFEHVTEPHLLRGGQAERRVVDREVAQTRWEPQPVRRVVDLVVGSDSLNVHRWRTFVERQMMRIDDADADITHKPQLAIRGFCDDRVIAGREPMAGHSVGPVENGRMDRLLWMGGPGVQLRPTNTYEATGQIQPDRTGVILHHPVNRIAGQSVLAGERENVAVFDPAQPTLSGDPECTVAIDVETADHSLSQPFDA